jgi:glycosyltransferase involved in cell wall biosynthesis
MIDNKSKIVIVGPAYPYRGGNSLYVSSVYTVLKNYFDVEVVNYKLLYPSILFPETTQNDESGKHIYQVPSKRIINSVNPFTWVKTAKYINSLNPDLIIFDWWNPFFGPALYTISKFLKRELKNKILFITENVISHEGRFIDKYLTKIGLRNSTSFLVLSDVVEKDVKLYSKQKPVYKSALPIYDCYILDENPDLNKIKNELGFIKGDIILLFFGYVRKYKGLNILIDAMKEVTAFNKNVNLLIVGEFYDSSEKYYSQIRNLNLSENIKVVEKFVPNEDVGKYYSIADLVVLPYLEGTQSGVLNIAYGFRKPVIVTDVGGLAEDVIENETGYIVESGNPDVLVDGIMKYLKNRTNIDFRNNIEKKLSENEFNKMPELIGKIIEDLKNADKK